MAKYKEGDFIVFNNQYATVISIITDSKDNDDLYELYFIKLQHGEHYWATPVRWVDIASRLPTATERLLYAKV